METKELIYFDRSRTTKDWYCPRARYLNYEYNGRGIVPQTQGIELFLGTVTHDSLAAIAHGVDIDGICEALVQQIESSLTPATSGEVNGEVFVKEQQALIEGLIRGYHKHVWPRLVDLYPTIISVEEEMTYKVSDGLIFMAKPDLILADREGNWYYIEFKTTSSKKEDWINSWNTAIQIHSTCKAVEQTKGQMPVATIVQGLYKGFVSYGKQSSPFCYAYKRNGNPPFSKDEISYEYKPGLKKYPVWEMEGGVKGWVEAMPETILADQFPQTPPIFIKEDLVNSFFAQRDIREHEIKLAGQILEAHKGDKEACEGLLNAAYAQKFDQCYPGWGRPCSYTRICHGHVENPIEDGFVYRESHHAPEAEMWKERENAGS